jgi:ABC-2 type transport system permease protein
MNMNLRLLELVKTHFRYYSRTKSVLMGSLAFPLIFIGVFGVAFQISTPGAETINLGIVVDDHGIPENANVYDVNGTLLKGNDITNDFIELLESITFEDNITNVFKIEHFSSGEEKQALDEVNKRDQLAILYIQNDFSLGFMAALRQKLTISQPKLNMSWEGFPDIDYQTDIIIKGDQTLQAFSIASSIIENVIDVFFNLGEVQAKGTTFLVEGSIDSKGLTAFDFVLPGLVVFALLNTLGVVANVALRDVQSGLLDRLRISKITSWEYTGSIIIGQLIVSLCQIPIMFGVGIMFGFPVSVDLILAFALAIMISLSMTGFGLIIAGIAKNPDAAGSTSAMIATPMAFLASAFFIVPNPEIVKIGSNSLGIMDLLPPTPAIEALRLVLLGGKSISGVWFQFALLFILTTIYLFAGIIIYSKKHLTSSK